jgi:hypothetical protein
MDSSLELNINKLIPDIRDDSVTRHGQVVLAVPHQYDSTATSHHCQYWLSSTITSMIRRLDMYFPDRQSGLEVNHQALRLIECHSN